MLCVKTFGSIVLAGALLVSAACGDSSKSMNPTAPSAVAAASLNIEATDATAESGTTADKGNPGKPDNPGNGNGNGKPDDKGKAPATDTPGNTSPRAPTAPTNPVTGKVQLEGLISAIAGTAITVNAQVVNVPDGTVIRHGSRAVAFSDLGVGDRVHVKARMQGAALEATEVKLQNPSGDDADDDGEDDADTAGRVWVSILDATATEGGTDQGAFRLMRAASATLPLTSPLTVTFTLSGTATIGSDYNLPLSATFPAGSATADVVVAAVADALVEGSETVILTLAVAAPYAIGSPTTGTVTITDAAPVVSVAAFDATAAETGSDSGTFRFSRTGAVTSSLTVTYTVTGTALSGTDYQAIPVTVTFLVGQATADVFVIPTADAETEGVETVIVTLTDGVAYDLGAPATTTATVTIAG